MRELLEKLKRDSESHKGQNGRVGVIAGSKDYTGAPALSAEAALRTGCDLAKVLTAKEVKNVVAGYSENLIVSDYGKSYIDHDSISRCVELSRWSDVMVIGPGLGEPDHSAVQKVIEDADSPLVVDADAIDAAASVGNLSHVVLTPHSGEAEVLEEGYGSVESFVRETGAKVVVKGSTDEIYAPKGCFELDVGASAMTVGGTGDVLTGVVASLISQGLNLTEAAKLGVWVNGRAGEVSTEELGDGMLATDMLENIPRVMK